MDTKAEAMPKSEPKSEKVSSPKSEKVSSLRQEQTAVHPYPEWATMQAYYGPRIGMPPQYFASPMFSGVAPLPLMWSTQPAMHPFGTPYAPIFPSGGFSHPIMPSVQGQGNTTSSTITLPNGRNITKSPNSSRQSGLKKRLNGVGDLAMSVSNGNIASSAGGTADSHSQSKEVSTEKSGDGSENEVKMAQGKRKLSLEATSKCKNGKGDTETSTKDINIPTISLGAAMATPHISDERQLKREKRKQSNRESARRSRLRKQAETEELAQKVETLMSEKVALISEINRLVEMSKKLTQDNSTLREELDILERHAPSHNAGCEEAPSAVLENLLTRLDNADPGDEDGLQETSSDYRPRVKLRQLLDPGPRTDHVAAS